MSQILPYAILSPAYVEYDYAAPAAAQRVIALIEAASPWVKAEHIGSTAIPGCAGKGIVDLVALYPRGRLEETRQAIDRLGFQHQRAGHEFPDDRPMRVGAIEYEGAIYRLHVHIVAVESAEAKALYRFRDVLRIDGKLRAFSNPEPAIPLATPTPRASSSTRSSAVARRAIPRQERRRQCRTWRCGANSRCDAGFRVRRLVGQWQDDARRAAYTAAARQRPGGLAGKTRAP